MIHATRRTSSTILHSVKEDFSKLAESTLSRLEGWSRLNPCGISNHFLGKESGGDKTKFFFASLSSLKIAGISNDMRGQSLVTLATLLPGPVPTTSNFTWETPPGMVTITQFFLLGVRIFVHRHQYRLIIGDNVGIQILLFADIFWVGRPGTLSGAARNTSTAPGDPTGSLLTCFHCK